MPRQPRDFSKEKIGKLQPLYIDESKPRGAGKNIYWICKCDCGNLTSVNSCNLNKYLKEQRNASCGKCNAQLNDLTGQTFGKLKVIKHDDSYISNKDTNWKHKWICECECGNQISVFGHNLTRLHTTSCGCSSRSIGEENIEKILKINGINYIKEFSFQDLKDKKKLRFDFAIFDTSGKLLQVIEFDGRQHTNIYTPWENDNDTLETRQKRDALKNEYCKNKNIKLVRIPYEYRDKITLQLLELEDYNKK